MANMPPGSNLTAAQQQQLAAQQQQMRALANATSQEALDEIVSIIRKYHPSLMNEKERVVSELNHRFPPSTEEDLLAHFRALLGRCFKAPIMTNDEIPRYVRFHVDRVWAKILQSVKHGCLLQEYNAMERDFRPPTRSAPNVHFPTNMEDLISRIKRWKDHLRYALCRPSDSILRLDNLSPNLARLQTFEFELPGQYFKDLDPPVENHLFVIGFEAPVLVKHRLGGSLRRIGFRTNDGAVHYFMLEPSSPMFNRSDERYAQMLVYFNRFLDKNKETRRRQMVFRVPIAVPLGSRLRMCSSQAGDVTMDEVYEHGCAVRGVDSDDAMLISRRTYARTEGGGIEANRAMRTQLYDSVSSNVVPDSMLSRFVHRSVPSPDQLFAFRKEFALQHGLCSFLCFSFFVTDRTPQKITFSKQSARMLHTEFVMHYNQTGRDLEFVDFVPFRLTRNITHFLPPVLIEGPFSAALISASMCFSHLKAMDTIKHFLYLFCRDDIVSWHTNGFSQSDVVARQQESTLRDKIAANSSIIYKRIQSISAFSDAREQRVRSFPCIFLRYCMPVGLICPVS